MGDFGKTSTENLLDLVKRTTKNRNYILEDVYVLDDENIIAVVCNPERRTIDDPSYIMIHCRVTEQELVELNRWNQPNYFCELIKTDSILEKLGYFLVQGNSRAYVYDAIYDYKNARFVIEKGIFDCIGFDNVVANASDIGKNYLKEYNCFLARFTVSSTICEDDVISYTNTITNDLIKHSFAPTPETYYVLINPDGTMRGNTLFMGDSFSKILGMVTLQTRSNITPDMPEDAFESLQLFKQERVEELTKIKNKCKLEHQIWIQRIGSRTSSPYLDDEVAKIISLKYNQNTWK